MDLSRTIGQSDETSKRVVVNDLPPVSENEERQGWKSAVTKTLGQLGVALPKDTTWSRRREVLREDLLILQCITSGKGVRKFRDIGENALTAVDWDVPCLLHLHKRIIEKMASMLFIESLNEVKSKAAKHRIWKAKQIQKILNKTVFDTPSNKGQYHLFMDNDGQLGEIK
jgi:hypothetical protein